MAMTLVDGENPGSMGLLMQYLIPIQFGFRGCRVQSVGYDAVQDASIRARYPKLLQFPGSSNLPKVSNSKYSMIRYLGPSE